MTKYRKRNDDANDTEVGCCTSVQSILAILLSHLSQSSRLSLMVVARIGDTSFIFLSVQEIFMKCKQFWNFIRGLHWWRLVSYEPLSSMVGIASNCYLIVYLHQWQRISCLMMKTHKTELQRERVPESGSLSHAQLWIMMCVIHPGPRAHFCT